MELDLLRRIVNSRIRFSYKKESKIAANFFNKWLNFWGHKCTDKGARILIEKNKDKFLDLLPSKKHKSYKKWVEESKYLNLI